MSILDSASLVQIPSGYKDGKLYSVVPDSGAGDLDFARSSTGTRVNEEGIVVSEGVNVPRLDYIGGCPKLLIEPQSTNNFDYSENFAANWSVYATASASDNQGISPDGANNATLLTKNNIFARIDKSLSLPSSTYTYSIFAKKGITDWIVLRVDGSIGFSFVSFDLGNGVVGNDQNIVSKSIEDYGNGWYRCSMTMTTTITVARCYVRNDGNYPTSNAVTADAYLWGATMEAIEIPTSYIPTSGTTATRTQDISQTTSSNIAAAINGEEGVLFIDFDRLGLDFEDSWMGLYKASNSFNFNIRILYRKERIIGYVRSNSYQAIMQYYGTWTMPRIKVALKWKVNDFALWVNGVEGATDTSGITFVADFLDTVKLGDHFTSANPEFESKINTLAVFNTALSDADLTELTTL